MACHPDFPLWNPHGFSSDTEFWEYGGSSHCLYAPCSEAENQSPENRHILAAEAIRDRYQIPIYACQKEEKTLQDPKINLTAYHMDSYTLKADVYLTDLQAVELAGFSVQMIETPGHTKGGVCYYLSEEGVLFSGDTLFRTSVGRTDFPTGSMSQIVRSLRYLTENLPGETVVYPGHQETTTIAYEQRFNPYLS